MIIQQAPLCDVFRECTGLHRVRVCFQTRTGMHYGIVQYVMSVLIVTLSITCEESPSNREY